MWPGFGPRSVRRSHMLPVPAITPRDCEARSRTPTGAPRRHDTAMLCAWALDRHFELPAVEIVPPSFREAYRALTEGD